MITFGSDPEFMLVDKKGNFKSAIGVINGSKEKRLELGNKHQAYYDNVLAEVSINPASSPDDAVEKFRDCFQKLSNIINPLRLKILSSTVYPDKECEHEEAQKFGCHPDYCAYRMEIISPPEVPVSGFRSAGGHVHIGFKGGVGESDEAVWNRVWVVRAMDLFIGLPSLLIDNDESAAKRRQLYGKAGAHRICEKYGVEYRSLSNFWLASPNLVKLVYDIAEFSVSFTTGKINKLEKIWDKEYKSMDLFDTMSCTDPKQAVKNVGKVEKTYMPIIAKYLPENVMKKLKAEINRNKPYDFYQEWNLK